LNQVSLSKSHSNNHIIPTSKNKYIHAIGKSYPSKTFVALKAIESFIKKPIYFYKNHIKINLILEIIEKYRKM
jgi:hypothetical protein